MPRPSSTSVVRSAITTISILLFVLVGVFLSKTALTAALCKGTTSANGDKYYLYADQATPAGHLAPRTDPAPTLLTITQDLPITLTPITYMPTGIPIKCLLIKEIFITTLTTDAYLDGSGNTIYNTSSVVLYFTEVSQAGSGGQSHGTTAGEIVGGIFLIIVIGACCCGASSCSQ